MSNDIPQFSCPSGTVTVSDNGKPLDQGTYSLNSQGFTEDQSMGTQASFHLSVSSHNLIASYAGDTSYNASSVTVPVTITKAATSTGGPTANAGPWPARQPFNLLIVAATQSIGVALAGTVQIFNGPTAISSAVPCSGSDGQLSFGGGAHGEWQM